MELVLKLKDESKLEALLHWLRRFTTAEGVDLTVESQERRTVLEAAPENFDWAKWDELMSRDTAVSTCASRLIAGCRAGY